MMEYDEEDGLMDLRLEQEAQLMTDRSFEEAVAAYVSQTGDLFDEAFSGPDPVTYAKKLADRLERDEKKLRHGIVRAQFLSPDEAERIVAVLCLPFDIHYNEYCYAGVRGSYDMDDRFDVDEQWGECRETEERSELVVALMNYCTSAGALARRIGAAAEQKLFMRALELMELNCRNRGYENEQGGMRKNQAETVCRWIVLATQRLWSQVKVADRQEQWKLSEDAAAQTVRDAPHGRTDAMPETPGAPPEALLQQACDGTVARLTSPEHMVEIAKAAAEIPLDGFTFAEKGADNDSLDETPDTSDIKPGAWALENVLHAFNGTTRTFVFKGNKGGTAGESITCPPDAAEPWKHLCGMVASTDPDGWYEVPKLNRRSFTQQFLRTDKDKAGKPTASALALRLFYAHIVKHPDNRREKTLKVRLMRRRERPLVAKKPKKP